MLPEACGAGSLAAMTRTLFSGGSIFDGTGAAVGHADLVIVEGDPLDVSTPADRISSVYQDGVQVI